MDIDGRRLMVLNALSDPPINYSYSMPTRIGTVVPCDKKDHVVVALENGIFSLELNVPSAEVASSAHPENADEPVKTVELSCGELVPIAQDPEAGIATNRFNDGKCDPFGRLWVGTMEISPPRKTTGALYCFDPADVGDDGELPVMRRVLEKIGVSNGVAWSSDGLRMFYIDSFEHCVSVLDYDPKTGEATGRKKAWEYAEEDGTPDGCTMDTEDRLWVAHFNGGQVTCTDTSTGERVTSIKIPGATQVTSCAFGGIDMGDLYVTTAQEGMGEEEKAKFPNSGALFVVRDIGATGRPTARLGI